MFWEFYVSYVRKYVILFQLETIKQFSFIVNMERKVFSSSVYFVDFNYYSIQFNCEMDLDRIQRKVFRYCKLFLLCWEQRLQQH